jgi:hypothetical protein
LQAKRGPPALRRRPHEMLRGTIVRIDFYLDRAQALEAAGLSE